MRSQNCVRYRHRRDVEASLWATAIIRAARTVMVTLLHSPGRAIAVCDGSGFDGPIETTLPHSDFGDPDCCGYLNGVIRGDHDGGAEKWGHYGREKGAGDVVTLWPY